MKKIIAFLFLAFMAMPVLAAENKYFAQECQSSPFACPVSETYINNKYEEDMANYETLLTRAQVSSNTAIINELKMPIRAGEIVSGKVQCYFGYVEENGRCNKIVVPKNGYLGPSGRTWACLYGFKKNYDSAECEPVENFFEKKVYTGDGWGCIFGYRKFMDICQKIVIPPANGYVDYANEDGWDCNKNYVKDEEGELCRKIEVPANAHMLESGKGWACNAGYNVKYLANGNKICAKVVKCLAGYRLVNNKCIK